jgi:pimeloyl-ACP methyl ester carboxylesterase
VIHRNQLFPVPGTGHLVQVEEPDRFDEAFNRLTKETAP